MNNLKQNYKHFIRLEEKHKNINNLLFITKFTDINFKYPKIFKITLNCSFKTINFNKKRLIPILLYFETLTGQKNLVKKAKTLNLQLNIKKNTYIACSLSLRNFFLYNFLDNMIFYIPKITHISIFNYLHYENNKTFNFIFWCYNLNNFFILNFFKEKFIKKISLNFAFNTYFFEEKFFLMNSLNLYIAGIYWQKKISPNIL